MLKINLIQLFSAEPATKKARDRHRYMSNSSQLCIGWLQQVDFQYLGMRKKS